MNYLDKFNMTVGDTIMDCQKIEHDIKIIYASMLKGDMQENLKLVSRETLGVTLNALEELDYSDNNPMLDRQDYKTLKQIKNIRNWLAHQCYVDFMYYPESQIEWHLNKTYQKLCEFNNTLKRLSVTVEAVRFLALKRYARV